MKRLLKTTVKHFTDEIYLQEPSHSKYGIEYGTFIKMLKHVLVDGWGEYPISNISFEEDPENRGEYWLCHLTTTAKAKDLLTVIEIKGSSLPFLNKQHRVQLTDLNRITIALPISEVTQRPQNLSGLTNVFISYPPLGWEVRFETADVLVLGIKEDKYSSYFLRFQDRVHPSLGSDYIRYCIASAYTQMENADDIGFRPDRLKMPFFPETPRAPEEGFDGPTAGSDGKFGTSSVLYGWYQSSDANSITVNSRDTLVRSFDLIGDEKTFYFSAGRSSYFFVPYMFGIYTPHNEDLNAFPYLLGSRKKDPAQANSTVVQGLGRDFYNSGGVSNSPYSIPIEMPNPLGSNLLLYQSDSNSNPPYFMFNWKSAKDRHKLGFQYSMLRSELPSGCAWGLGVQNSDIRTISPVTVNSCFNMSNHHHEANPEGVVRGMRHIVESTTMKPEYFNIYKDGRFFGALPYTATRNWRDHANQPTGGAYPGILNGNIAFALDTWDE